MNLSFAIGADNATVADLRVEGSNGVKIVPGSGNDFIYFDADRDWKFYSTGQGTATDLRLKGIHSGKYYKWEAYDGKINMMYYQTGTDSFIQFQDLKKFSILSDVGIGTNSPSARLHVNGNTRLGTTANGTIRITNNSTANYIQSAGPNYSGNKNLYFTGLNGGTGNTLFFNYANVGIGTSTPDYKLDVIGTIRAHEIIVSTEGADFVFDIDYELKSLSEVESHIESYGHLPDVPSAQKMQTEGVAISEMQTMLLQKVEELTLYVIAQDKKIEAQQLRIEDLESN